MRRWFRAVPRIGSWILSGEVPSMTLLGRRGLSDVKRLGEGMLELRMPSIMTAKEGTLDKWLVKEGDEFLAGTPLCEVTLEDLTVSVDAPSDGIVSALLVTNGQGCKVNDPIAHFAGSKEAYLAHLDSRRVQEHDKQLVEQAAAAIEDSSKKPDVKTLLREIRHLIETKELDQESDFVKKLLSLARKGDPDLMASFEASYEGKSFNSETFDHKFFLDNAKGVVEDKVAT